MGAEAIMAVNRDGQHYRLTTESKDVVDVTGAGDTVISHLAAGIANGLPIRALTDMNRAARSQLVGLNVSCGSN